MSFKDKVYVAFDGANELEWFKKMQEFKNGDNEPFKLISSLDLKPKFDKVSDEILKVEIQKRISEASVAVIFVSPTTKSMRRFIRWQVDFLLNNNFPIICINLNSIRSVDFDLLPAVLKRSSLSLHIPFEEKVLDLALENWPKTHKELFMKEKKGTFRIPMEVYDNYVVVTETEEEEE